MRIVAKLTKKWLKSRRSRFQDQRAAPDPSVLTRLVALGLLLRYALSIERAFIHEWETRPTPAPLVDLILDAFLPRELDVLLTARLIAAAAHPDVGGVGMRRRTRLALSGGFAELLSNRTLMDKAFYPISRGANYLAEQVGIPLTSRHEESQALLKAVHGLDLRGASLNEDDRSTATSLRSALFERARIGIEAQSSMDDPEFLNDLRVTAFGRYLERPNRWESVDILLSNHGDPQDPSPYADQEQHVSALNVFSVDGASLTPIALHTLCIVRHAGERGIDSVAIFKKLQAWGFDGDNVDLAFASMLDIDRRLIFAHVRDAGVPIKQWRDGFHQVYLSSAGREYLDSVVPSASYLQWALLHVDDVRGRLPSAMRPFDQAHESALRRLRAAFHALVLVEEDEVRRIGRLQGTSYHSFNTSMSPFSWVYFAGLEGFIKDLSGLKHADESEARSLAEEFLELGRRALRHHDEHFQVTSPEWQANLDYAERTFQRRFLR